jgi:hypothetical protein
MSKEINENKQVQQILIDMVHHTPIEVYRKHGVGLKTQDKIKEMVVSSFFEEISENCCRLCKSKLLK